MNHQNSDGAGLWLIASGQPIRVQLLAHWSCEHEILARIIIRYTHTRNLNWTPNLRKMRWILITRFYIDGRTTRRAVALRRWIFKRKKWFANHSLGLIYRSKALPQPPSRDTVPLTQYLWHKIFTLNYLIFS
jgi:hypothetical protein